MYIVFSQFLIIRSVILSSDFLFLLVFLLAAFPFNYFKFHELQQIGFTFTNISAVLLHIRCYILSTVFVLHCIGSTHILSLLSTDGLYFPPSCLNILITPRYSVMIHTGYSRRVCCLVRPYLFACEASSQHLHFHCRTL